MPQNSLKQLTGIKMVIYLKKFFEDAGEQREEVKLLAGMDIMYSQAAQSLTDFTVFPNVDPDILPEIKETPEILYTFPHLLHNIWRGSYDPVFIGNRVLVVRFSEEDLTDLLVNERQYEKI